jgi:hypothetical protein
MRRASTPERVLLRLKSANSLPDQPERERGLRCKATYPLPLAATIPARRGPSQRAAEYSVSTANPMDGVGTADVGAAGPAKDEKSYLPLLDQITDRVGHLLDRRRDRRGVDRAGQYSRCQTGSGSPAPPLELAQAGYHHRRRPACCARNETVSANTSSHHCRIGYSARLGFPNSISWCAPLLITVRVSLTTAPSSWPKAGLVRAGLAG